MGPAHTGRSRAGCPPLTEAAATTGGPSGTQRSGPGCRGHTCCELVPRAGDLHASPPGRGPVSDTGRVPIKGCVTPPGSSQTTCVCSLNPSRAPHPRLRQTPGTPGLHPHPPSLAPAPLLGHKTPCPGSVARKVQEQDGGQHPKPRDVSPTPLLSRPLHTDMSLLRPGAFVPDCVWPSVTTAQRPQDRDSRAPASAQDQGPSLGC